MQLGSPCCIRSFELNGVRRYNQHPIFLNCKWQMVTRSYFQKVTKDEMYFILEKFEIEYIL